jgi:hypothetical protein
MTNAIEKSKQAALAQYGSFDLEDMQKEAAELPTGGGNFFKPHEGKNVVRFMPPPQGRKAFVTYHKHYFAIGKERKNIICTKYQYSQPCDICSKSAALRASGNKVDMRKARALEPQSQVYVNVVDMKNPEKGVQLWTMSPGVFKAIMDAIDTAGVKGFADPIKGYNIAFKRTGQGTDTRYTGHTVARESTELPNWEELLPTQMDLSSVEEAPSDEQVEEALDGEFEERGGGKGSGGGKKERDVTPKRADAEDADDADADVPH